MVKKKNSFVKILLWVVGVGGIGYVAYKLFGAKIKALFAKK